MGKGNMTIHIGAGKVLLLALLIAIVIIILLLPFTFYTHKFKTNLLDNQEKWANLNPGQYIIVVASNAYTACTGGWNTIHVVDGKVTQGRNSEHDDCTLEDFNHLTVEALFNRIWDECIHRRPWYRRIPVCNVAYNDLLGYPRRLDTYINAEGEYLPAITVDSVTLSP
jgi:hypothetical protein